MPYFLKVRSDKLATHMAQAEPPELLRRTASFGSSATTGCAKKSRVLTVGREARLRNKMAKLVSEVLPGCAPP